MKINPCRFRIKIQQESGGHVPGNTYNDSMDTHHHYQLISDTLHWLFQNQKQQPTLEETAKRVGLSPHYLQRLFQQWVGVSPKQFVKYLTKSEAIARLKQGQTVLDSALSSGLSGPGRLHDLVISTEAMTPGEARQKGLGVKLEYGHGMTPFGETLLAWNERGICFLGFCHDKGVGYTLSELHHQWPDASMTENSDAAHHRLTEIFSEDDKKKLRVWLRGSPFQLRIWEALIKIPPGTHCTYGQVASLTGHPGASRATGTAIGRNPVSWLIPCHRVIGSLGQMGGYRWGVPTKQALIGYEAAVSKRSETPMGSAV